MSESPIRFDSSVMKAAADRRRSGFEPEYERCCAILSRRSLKYLKWAIVLTSPVLTVSAILLAPRYLAYVESPRQSDAVILFVGGDYEARLREARQLIADGYASHLIIPAYGQVQKQGPDGKLESVDSYLKLNTSNLQPRPQDELLNTSNLKPKTASWLEDTHTEVLVARQMMERSGFRTAILVSSRYHMRRVKLIADRVFTQTHYRLHFVPTRYESTKSAFWFLNGPEFARVTSEYIKIAWFQLYSRFAS
jgi:uncharacterized SAM-binding protein YcdF (DUF218 family)